MPSTYESLVEEGRMGYHPHGKWPVWSAKTAAVITHSTRFLTLAQDLMCKLQTGFSAQNMRYMRKFYHEQKFLR
jgi:hypothetical protein